MEQGETTQYTMYRPTNQNQETHDAEPGANYMGDSVENAMRVRINTVVIA